VKPNQKRGFFQQKLINVTSPDFYSLRENIELKDGDSIRQDIHISDGSGVLFGTVWVNGEIVADPHVSLRWIPVDGSGQILKTSNNRTGSGNGYRFEYLPAGRYEILIRHPLQYKQVVHLGPNEELRVDIDYVTGNGSIQGTVDAHGHDLELATTWVFLFKAEACPWKIGGSISYHEDYLAHTYVHEGNYYKDQLPAGSYEVVAVLEKDRKILKLDIEQITLADGECRTVGLDVADD
jgi:hypothetical protein